MFLTVFFVLKSYGGRYKYKGENEHVSFLVLKSFCRTQVWKEIQVVKIEKIKM